MIENSVRTQKTVWYSFYNLTVWSFSYNNSIEETKSGPHTYPAKGYTLNGKITLTPIVDTIRGAHMLALLHIYMPGTY